MKFCATCRTELDSTAKFCPTCGATQSLAQPVARASGPTTQETKVKTYSGRKGSLAKEVEHDIGRMAKDGWRVQGQNTIQGSRGSCLGCLSLGIFALFFPPKHKVVVTYVRDVLAH